MMHPDTPWPHDNRFHAELTLPTGLLEARPVPPPWEWRLSDTVQVLYNGLGQGRGIEIVGGAADAMRTQIFLRIETVDLLPLGPYFWSFEFDPIEGIVHSANYVPLPGYQGSWQAPLRIDLITGGRGTGRTTLIVQHLIRHALASSKPAVLFVDTADQARSLRDELAEKRLADWVWVTSTDGYFTDRNQDWGQFCVSGLDLSRQLEPDRVPVPVAAITVLTSGPLEIR